MKDLLKRLRELEHDHQRERERAEKAERRAEGAEQDRQRERERAEKEQQRAEEAEQQTRPTTLDEYITACHSSVFSKLTIETDPKQGSITNPQNKWCPTTIQPWTDLLDEQRAVFGALYGVFPTERRVFENKNFLDGLGNRISKRSVADEKALEYFLHNSVEDLVRHIIEQLKELPGVFSVFDIGNGIIFENHAHAISDTAKEVVVREGPTTLPQTPGQLNHNQLRADQICIYRSDSVHSSRRTMAYISEYKPPHKLTAPHLRLGLRPINIYKEVVNRKTILTSVDPETRF